MSTLQGLIYSERALGNLAAIPLKTRKQIIKKIQMLPDNPRLVGYKALQGLPRNEEHTYRIRSGDYRVLYYIRSNPSHIVVIDIGNRKDIYR